MPQKTEGNMDDAMRVIQNLKDGLAWHIAIRTGEFMPVEVAWYDKNRALFFDWMEKGIPKQPGLIESTAREVKSPINTAVTPDGKVWGIYRDEKGGLYREEIATASPEVSQTETEKKESERLMAPSSGVEFSPVPSKNRKVM
jgi:hypothetical protein